MLVSGLGALRVGIAGWAMVAPERLAAALGVSDAQLEAARPYVRALGVREVLLGVGTVSAVLRGRSGAGWLGLMAATDVFDSVAYVLLSELGTLEEQPARRAAAFAGASAAAEGLTALRLLSR